MTSSKQHDKRRTWQHAIPVFDAHKMRAVVLIQALLLLSGAAFAQLPFGTAPAPTTTTLGGNLLPPSPPPSQESMQTQQELERSERVDSGRGLAFFWIDPEIGGRYYNLDLFGGSNLGESGGYKEDGFVPSLGLGIGARFLYLTAGARFRFNFTHWTAGLEGALRIPLGKFEPYVLVGGGYLRSVDFSDKCGGCFDDMVISGGYGTVGGGVDYFLSPVFALGLRLDADVLFVGRDAVEGIDDGTYAKRGSGVGLGSNLGLHCSLHF